MHQNFLKMKPLPLSTVRNVKITKVTYVSQMCSMTTSKVVSLIILSVKTVINQHVLTKFSLTHYERLMNL